MEQRKTTDKIFKAANDKSTIDVQASLHFWKEKPIKKEAEYKGNIIFSISDHSKKPTTFGKAFVDKSTTKVLMKGIQAGMDKFKELFPKGFSDFGGSGGKEVRARIMKVEISNESKKQFKLSIQEGKGEKGESGSFKMISTDVSVVKYMGYIEMLKMSYEVLDYIHHAELIAMMKGTPLNSRLYTRAEETITEVKEKVNPDSDLPSIKDVEKQKIRNQVILAKLGNIKIERLQEESLKFILLNLQPIDKESIFVFNEAKSEMVKRKKEL